MADFAITNVRNNTHGQIKIAAIRQHAADTVLLHKSRGRIGPSGICISEIADDPKDRLREFQKRIQIH